MTKTYKVKRPPFKEVVQYYHKIFDGTKDRCNYSFEYYWYFANEQRIWGCMVSKNGELYDYSHQLSLNKMREYLR